MMTFDIEAYLNSLPEDIIEINISRRNLKILPDLSKFTNLKKLDCSNNELMVLPILNEKLEVLICYNNQLTVLPILNKKLEILICCNNQLIVLPILNEHLKMLWCIHNQLTVKHC